MNLRKINNSYKFKRRNFEKEAETTEILILGNSHAYYGVDPQYLSLKGFNLANATQSFFYDRAITLKYLPKLKKLKLVLIPVSYFSFYYQMKDIAENWRDFAYDKFWDIRYPGLSYWDSRNYSYLMMYSPQKSIDFFLKEFKPNLTEGVEYNGHFHKDTTGNYIALSDAVGKMIQKTHTSMINLKQEEKNVWELTSLIDTLQKKGIGVALFTTPVAETYSKYCDPAIIARNNKIVGQIVAQYHCPYKNYFFDKRFELHDFGDNDHLNFIGAAKFSRILDNEIIQPLLTGSNK